MADDVQAPLAAALAELARLRAENQRLRGLLGMDARRRPIRWRWPSPPCSRTRHSHPPGRSMPAHRERRSWPCSGRCSLAVRMCTPPAGRNPGRVARRLERDGETVAEIVDGFLEEIYAALKHGDSVSLRGFGSFHVQAERDIWVFKFNPSQRLRALFGWSLTYRGPL
jgi:DNA-binding protein HU-beta